jgi:hypothetical protein
VDARSIGLAVRDLKLAARAQKHLCGVLLHRKTGDRVAGEPVATILTPVSMREEEVKRAVGQVGAAFAVGSRAVAPPWVISDVIGP